MAQKSTITTRILIISDTHGISKLPHNNLHHPVDVVLHCGDMSEDGSLEHYKNTLHLLSSITAELKLVIAGNHDTTLDSSYFDTADQAARQRHQNALRLMKGPPALRAGVTYLHEGFHAFSLSNGARFTVWASPYTPSFCDWAFGYDQRYDRFNQMQHTTTYAIAAATIPIPKYPGVDIIMTHGPPLGHLDQLPNGAFLGCRNLQRAVARAQPRLHCFGHIHEGRGAEIVQWDGHIPDYDTDGSVRAKETLKAISDIDVSVESASPLQRGRQTLMVNAAVMDGGNKPVNGAWVVKLELPAA